jgi:hypothetical protein
MMNMFVSFLAAAFLIAGCSGHFYRQEQDHVHLFLKDSQAREVLFSSSLEGFGLERAQKTGEGTWDVTVPKGREFRYFYVIDGKVHVPDCRYREKDDFGAYNCLFRSDL